VVNPSPVFIFPENLIYPFLIATKRIVRSRLKGSGRKYLQHAFEKLQRIAQNF
jgi:hypothetical protein